MLNGWLGIFHIARLAPDDKTYRLNAWVGG
jgi:hypothetical protein